jgi:hypothetical protein
MKEAYHQQKSSAKKRGIEFYFTYQEWCDWWERQLGPDWWKLRGCKRGQFVMARYGDEGPYQWGNVEAVTAEENIRRYNKRRTPVKIAGTTHLNHDVVRRIYLDPRKYALIAEEYGVTKHRIQCIKQKHYYRRITDELD